jgi:outer membrane immunogenic protein
MKTTKILVAAMALAVTQPAFAGGMNQPAYEDNVFAGEMESEDIMDVLTEASTDWSGVYIGLDIGSQTLSGDVAGTDMNLSLHGGYNIDLGDLVVGAEIDYSPMATDLDGGGEMKNAMSAKVRAGYDMGDLLPYASMGMQRAAFNTGSDDMTANGIVYGAGVNYKLSDNLILGGELTRASFNDFDGGGNDAERTNFGVKISLSF